MIELFTLGPATEKTICLTSDSANSTDIKLSKSFRLSSSALFSETKQIKFGTGVISLPQQHPAIVAGHAALFDNLSKGRFLFGVGAGGLVSDWELFDNLDGKTRALTMLDSIDAILSIWNSNEALNYKSDFINFKVENNYIPELGIGTFIKPFEKPHPPIAVSLKNANSMTAKFAGKKGWIPISGNFVPAEDIATHWPTYLEGARESGKKSDYDSWRVGRSVLITETSQQANEILTPSSLCCSRPCEDASKASRSTPDCLI